MYHARLLGALAHGTTRFRRLALCEIWRGMVTTISHDERCIAYGIWSNEVEDLMLRLIIRTPADPMPMLYSDFGLSCLIYDRAGANPP